VKKKLYAAMACTVLAATMTACSGVNAAPNAETITFATVAGWDDTEAVTALWTALLEDRDYNVDTVAVDLAAGISGIARGDLDGYLNVWLPSTHAEPIAKFRDDLVILDKNGPFYDDNRQVLAVPAFVEEDTVADLVKNAKKYDSRIVGIEAGSGNMKQLPELLKAYDAQAKLSIVDGSTPAALAELEKSVQSKKPVVISLWQPHWVFANPAVKALKDPKQGWPKPDGSYVALSKKFAAAQPEIVEWMSNSKLTTDQYSSLMMAVSEAGSDPVKGARQWMETPENKQAVDTWFK
jgi:glycine betaine/proline transport system substrate-binding protein